MVHGEEDFSTRLINEDHLIKISVLIVILYLP